MISEIFDRAVKGPWSTGGLDVQYRVEMTEDEAFLFFQGSVSMSDWIYNGMVEPYRDMEHPWKAHKGFVLLYKSIADMVANLLKVAPVGRLTVAGYSQGAALATLAHEDMKYRNPGWTVRTFAFGSPRVLWCPDGHVQALFGDIQRYSLRGDPVPMLPPAIIGYRHVGEENMIGPVAFTFPTNHNVGKYREALKGA